MRGCFDESVSIRHAAGDGLLVGIPSSNHVGSHTPEEGTGEKTTVCDEEKSQRGEGRRIGKVRERDVHMANNAIRIWG